MPFVQARGQYTVSGRIQTESKEDLAGVSVMFYRGDTLLAGGVSGLDGVYEFRDMPKGVYEVRFSYLGYKVKRQPLTVERDVRMGSITMEEESYSLSEVSVSGDRRSLINAQAGSTRFFLSEKALQESRNVYQALREIPSLSVDEVNRSIKMQDGSEPIILINGVRRPDVVSTLDPSNIESVEVIDNPSARYLGEEDVVTVLNLKLKRNVDISHSVEVSSTQMFKSGYGGLNEASYAMEKEDLSLRVIMDYNIFQRQKGSLENWSDTGELYRYLIGDQEYSNKEFVLSIGGDWVISTRDYIAYNMNLDHRPSDYEYKKSGWQETDGIKETLNISSGTEEDYLTGSYSLFYRRTFTPDKHLELLGQFGHYSVSPFNWYEEKAEDSFYDEEIDMNNTRQTYNLEANYDFNYHNRFMFDIGSNTYHQRAMIKDQSESFLYKEIREYVYADMRNAGNQSFSYMLSLGVDVVYRDADGERKTYVNFLPAISLSYKFKNSATLRLNLDRKRTSPSLSTLNPSNTSSDSLYVKTGNPYLRPEVSNNITLTYTWLKGGLYLQPSVKYTYLQDVVSQTGRLDGNVYIRTYENVSQGHRLRVGFTGRVTLGKYGDINFSPYYQKTKMDGMPFNGDTWGINGSLYLTYKNVWFNYLIEYFDYNYRVISKTKKSPGINFLLGWKLPKGWEVYGCLNYGMPWNKTWIQDDSYSAYNMSDYKFRTWAPMISVSYTFRSKSQLKQRNKKEIQNTERDDFRVLTP